MDSVISWVAILAPIIVGFVGWLLNTLITKRIDDLEKKQDDDRVLFFQRLDIVKDAYVRKDMYEQALGFHQKETDAKFNNLVDSMNKQFINVEKSIDEVKTLINSKMSSKSPHQDG